MNDNTLEIHGTNLDDAYTNASVLAQQLVPALSHRFAQLRDTCDALADTPPACTGVAYWRNDAGAAKLYFNHGIDVACPVHGTPPPGKRLRSYIGTNRQHQLDALDRANNAETIRTLTARLTKQRTQITAALTLLEQAFERLGYGIDYSLDDIPTVEAIATWPQGPAFSNYRR